MWPAKATIRDGDGRPKIHRYYLLGTGKTLGVFLHHIVGDDAPAEFHDHPWTWAIAWVLRGGYVEERLNGRRWLGPGRLNVLRPGVFHRVELRAGRPAWTLLVHSRVTHRWGFLDAATGAFRHWTAT